MRTLTIYLSFNHLGMSKITLESFDHLVNTRAIADSENVVLNVGLLVMLPAGFGYFDADPTSAGEIKMIKRDLSSFRN